MGRKKEKRKSTVWMLVLTCCWLVAHARHIQLCVGAPKHSPQTCPQRQLGLTHRRVGRKFVSMNNMQYLVLTTHIAQVAEAVRFLLSYESQALACVSLAVVRGRYPIPSTPGGVSV